MHQQTLASKVIGRIRRSGRGSVFTPKDFLDLAGRGTVGSALARLADASKIRRIGRGLYDLPRFNERLNVQVAPDPTQVARAIARQTGAKVTPSGAMAANQLGLTTQVPAKLVYLTNGDSRTVRVGKQSFVLKGVVPKDFDSEQSPAAMVLRALKHIGKDAIDEQVIAKLRRQLPDKDKRELLRRSAYMTDWLRSLARKIASGEGERNG